MTAADLPACLILERDPSGLRTACLAMFPEARDTVSLEAAALSPELVTCPVCAIMLAELRIGLDHGPGRSES